MNQQTLNFNGNVDTVNVNGGNDSRTTEPIPMTINTKDRTLKQWYTETANIVATYRDDPKYGASSLGRDALSFFRKIFPYHDKILKYWSTIKALLDTLP